MSDRYDIVKLIYKDQIGGVYLAEDNMLERQVAFRNFERLHGEEMLSKPNKAFAKFSGKLTAIQHPNIVTIYDIAFDEGEAYIVTQYIDTESLSGLLEQGAFSQQEAFHMAADILEALHSAHSNEVFHGALNLDSIRRKPRARGGFRYIVVDMGLNHMASIIRGGKRGVLDPVLMAPELSGGGKVDARVDLFMLAQLCYTVIACGHPFAGKSAQECAELYTKGKQPPLNEFADNIQEDFSDWIASLSHPDPDQRPASVEEAMKTLHAIELPDDKDEPHLVAVSNELPMPASGARLITTPAEQVAQQPAQSPTPTAFFPTSDTKTLAPTTQVTSAPTQPLGNTTNPMPAEPQQNPIVINLPPKNNRRPFIVIGILVALIAVGAVALIVGRPNSDSTKTAEGSIAYGLEKAPEGKKIYFHEPQAIEGDEIDLKIGNPIDWQVYTDVPLASKFVRKQAGGIIISTEKIGEFFEKTHEARKLIFDTTEGKMETYPTANISGMKSPGSGWSVKIRTPKPNQSPLLVALYVTHPDHSIEVTAKHEKGDKESQVVEPNTLKTASSLVIVELNHEKGAQSYTLTVVPKAKNDESRVFGLRAIQVNTR